jgi:hypothetical protein
MSLKPKGKTLTIPQRAIELLGGSNSLKKLGVVSFNANSLGIKFNFLDPFPRNITIARYEQGWDVLLRTDDGEELALLRKIPDAQLKRSMFLLAKVVAVLNG